MDDPDAPKDRYHFVFMGMFLLGMSTLFSVNFFIIATDYFNYKLRNVDDPSVETTLQTKYENSAAVATKIPVLFFLFLNTALAHRVSLNKRMIGSIWLIIVMFLFTTVLAQIDSDNWQTVFFVVTIISVVIINAGSAVMQGAVFGLGGMLPPYLMKSIFTGQALGGIFAALANIASLAFGSSSVNSGTGYFATAVAVLLISFFVYIALWKTAVVQYYVTKSKNSDALTNPVNDDDKIYGQSTPSISLIAIAKKCSIYAVSISLVFFTTLNVYPAVTASVRSVNMSDGSQWTNKYFTPVCCFLLYNISDFVGRLVASWLPLPIASKRLLLILSALRLVFVPLFMLCNAQPRHYLPVVFNSDIYFVAFILLMALSNGYLGTLSMVYGPQMVEGKEQETAGSMMNLFLVLGLSIGSTFSFADTSLL